MKNVIIKSIFAIAISVFITSCAATHNGYMANSASLSAANFSYVKKDLRGQATATYIFGFGGIARKTLVDDAKRQMLASNPLKNNQTLANLTVNFKTASYAGYVVNIVTCTVTADLVEFNK